MICISDCPVVWARKLQPDIALSTMESEYMALSTAMKDVIAQSAFGAGSSALA